MQRRDDTRYVGRHNIAFRNLLCASIFHRIEQKKKLVIKNITFIN